MNETGLEMWRDIEQSGVSTYCVKNFNEEKAISYINQSVDLDPIEGIWQDTSDRRRYLIEKSVVDGKRSVLKYRVVILHTGYKDKLWNIGDIKMFIERTSVNGVFFISYYTKYDDVVEKDCDYIDSRRGYDILCFKGNLHGTKYEYFRGYGYDIVSEDFGICPECRGHGKIEKNIVERIVWFGVGKLEDSAFSLQIGEGKRVLIKQP